MPYDQKQAPRAFLRLLDIMQRLRQPDGCPWDQEQTAESLTPYILEEACEVIDAIDQGDDAAICEELGDLLLQVVFQAEIASSEGRFDISDICTSISDKLIRRHPHVFQEDHHCDRQSLDDQWEQIKQQEKGQTTDPGLNAGIPAHLPNLSRAVKILRRAHKRSIPLPGPAHTACETEEALGHQLLALCAEAAHNGTDPERALRQALNRWCKLEEQS